MRNMPKMDKKIRRMRHCDPLTKEKKDVNIKENTFLHNSNLFKILLV